MRKVLFVFLAALVLSLGCAITNYPVIYDASGADSGVMQSFYDKAYIIPSGQVATIWTNGTDELYTEVTQDWKGDQWLYTFNNFDASGSLYWLDQTYCDPVRQTDCALAVAWNPDLPEVYPHGDQSAGYNNVDNIFDYYAHPECPGWRSLSVLVSYGSRYMGECGSGVWGDKQGAMYEFSQLDQVNFRGKSFYHLPLGADVASVTLTDQYGATTDMPFFGRFNLYLDKQLRLAVPVTPNMAHQARWFQNYTQAHGSYINANLVYGSLTSQFHIDMVGADNFAGRF